MGFERDCTHIILPLIVAVGIALMLTRPRGISEVWAERRRREAQCEFSKSS